MSDALGVNLHSDTGEGYGIELGALPFDEAEVTIHRYHSSIVRSVGELRDEDLPAIAACVVVEGLALADTPPATAT